MITNTKGLQLFGKMVNTMMALVHSTVRFLRRILDRLVNVLLGQPLDPVAFLLSVASLAQAVRLAAAAGFLPAPATRDAAWTAAVSMFNSAIGFYAAIMPPAFGLMWLIGGALVILVGVGISNRNIELCGVVITMSYWSYTCADIWLHLGWVAAVTFLVWVLASGWVFDDIYRRRQEERVIDRIVRANIVLVAQINEGHLEEVAKLQSELRDVEQAVAKHALSMIFN